MTYEKVFITWFPSFYKVRLFNEIAKRQSVYVIFIKNDKRNQRLSDFFGYEKKFEYVFLNDHHPNLHLAQLLFSLKYKELVLGGWDSVQCWIGWLMTSKRKNACVIESSILESKLSGIKYFVKRLFARRVSKMYVAGKLQEQLARKLGFNSHVVKVYGCGILNYASQPKFVERTEVKNFICVARLIEVKNLEMLIQVFNGMPELSLSIIGVGPLKDKLHAAAGPNVHFVGAVPNNEIYNYYRDADVFVLPSKSEPWGLVVEEALNNGLPVIVSNQVGCKDDLVTPDSGLVFDYDNPDDLKSKIMQMTNIVYYNKLRRFISKLNFIDRIDQQVNAYIHN